MLIKCENCGATLPYDAKLQKIKCEYCGTICSLDLLRLSLGNTHDSSKSMEAELPICTEEDAALMIDKAKKKRYLYALSLLEKNTEESIAEAQRLFWSLEDFDDSQYQAERCVKLMAGLIDLPKDQTSDRPSINSQGIKIALVCIASVVMIFWAFGNALESTTPNELMTVSSKLSQPTTAVSEQVEYIPMDYRELAVNPKQYHNTYVRVAGRISRTNNAGSGYFNEGILETANDRGFLLDFEDDITLTEGEYIVVEGQFKDSISSTLEKCRIVKIGAEAEQEAKPYEDAWTEKRNSEVEGLPIVDFMEVVENSQQYEGQLVRVSGTIGRVYVNYKNDEVNFPNRIMRDKWLSVSLKSCDYTDKQLCTTGTDIVVSGIVSLQDRSVELYGCNIEAIGESAAEAVAQAEQGWRDAHELTEAGYIASCTQLGYDELARYPEKLKGQQIMIKGTVVSNDDRLSHDRVIVDMVGDSASTVCVEYTGRVSVDEPLLLPGDSVTFYGTFDGLTSYPVGEDIYEKSLYITSAIKR